MADRQGEKAEGGEEPAASGKTESSQPAKPAGAPGTFKRVRRAAYKTAFLVTAITSAIPGTVPNRALKLMQKGGVFPTFGDLDSHEVKEQDYLRVAGDGFAGGIDARPLPDIPLQPTPVSNFVIEPNGEHLPSYFMHGEPIVSAFSLQRMNTVLLHDRNVASSYYLTLEKTLGRKPRVRLIDGFASEGVIFNGPQVELFKDSKTIINKSVGAASFEPTTDTSHYKAWVFYSAGNLGYGGPANIQPQLGGQVQHSPRSVAVGSSSDSTHCGPVFYTDAATSGKIKRMESRLSYLPSELRKGQDGYEKARQGWGATSMASPTAAAKFAALMERYGNYLSEEEIFAALCYATAKTTKRNLAAELAKARREDPWNLDNRLREHASYESTNTPARPAGQPHFYDPVIHGFGKIPSEAVAEADELCQDMVIYTQYRPSVTTPTTIAATMRLSEQAAPDADGVYVYKVKLPDKVNLGSVKIEGHARTHNLGKEKFEIVASGIRIRIPVANASGCKEQEWVDQGAESDFIGSTRGFTTAGPVGELEIRSTVPLDRTFCLTCYNTLGKEDMVSRFDSLHADVDHLQLNGKGPILSLSTAKRIDPQRIEPAGTPVSIHIYPANATAQEIAEDQRRAKQEQERPPENGPGDAPADRPAKQEAYWRRREETPPPGGPYPKGKA